MFAEEPPSSSDPMKRLSGESALYPKAFRRILLQIGGANIAGADRALQPPTSSALAEEIRLTFSSARRRAIRRYVQVMQSTAAVVSRSSTGISWPIRGGCSLRGRKTWLSCMCGGSRNQRFLPLMV